MNKITIGLSGVVLGLVVLASAVQAQEAVPSKLAAFGKQSNQILFQKNHLYVFNGTTSVGLDPDHFGVHRLVAPPYFAYPFSADLQLFAGPGIASHRSPSLQAWFLLPLGRRSPFEAALFHEF